MSGTAAAAGATCGRPAAAAAAAAPSCSHLPQMSRLLTCRRGCGAPAMGRSRELVGAIVPAGASLLACRPRASGTPRLAPCCATQTPRDRSETEPSSMRRRGGGDGVGGRVAEAPTQVKAEAAQLPATREDTEADMSVNRVTAWWDSLESRYKVHILTSGAFMIANMDKVRV
eukprot:362129-Chlamydomonas_euryale.AAC.6